MKALMRLDLGNLYNKHSFRNVCTTLETLKLDQADGTIRKQPYCVLLTGFPGCGKSNFALQIATACLKARYGAAFPSDVVTLNETDEYQSEYRTSHKVVIFDDIGAAKITSPQTKDPWRKIIDFVNNIRKTSLNPNVEMKGVVYIEPDLVILTSNLKDKMNIGGWLYAPQAIFRRLSKIILLSDGYTEGRYIKPVYEGKSEVNAYSLTWNSNDATSPPQLREELIEEIVTDFTKHLSEQEIFVSRTNSNFDAVLEEQTPLQAFYSDVIRPILPKKIDMEKYLERQLPWYHRLVRKMCVIDHTIATIPIAQVQPDLSDYPISDVEETIYEPQSGIKCTALDEDVESHTLNYLASFVNWPFYKCIRPKFSKDDWVQVFQNGFQQYGLFYCTTGGTIDNAAVGLSCTIETLDRAYSLSNLESYPNILVPDAGDSKSIASKPDTSTVAEEVSSPKFDEDDSFILEEWLQTDDKWLKGYTMDLQRPLDNNIQNVILSAPLELELVGYELTMKRSPVDLVFRYKTEFLTTYYIVEVKSQDSLNKALKQARKYVRVLSSTAQRGPKTYLVAVAFNDTDVKGNQLPSGNPRPAIVDAHQLIVHWRDNYLDRCGAVESDTEKHFMCDF